MSRPTRLESEEIRAWLEGHPGWERVGEALSKRYTFADFAGALAFAVRVGMAAERRDHHPDLEVGWGKARAVWTTHDAKGITALDLELAEKTDSLAGSDAT